MASVFPEVVQAKDRKSRAVIDRRVVAMNILLHRSRPLIIHHETVVFLAAIADLAGTSTCLPMKGFEQEACLAID